MKIRRKWISAIIPVSISLFLTAESVLAGTIQQGTHLYKAPLSDTIITQTYYYSDDYFKKPGTERNPNLLGMSFSLAAATFEAGGSSYVTGLLEETGFSDVKAQDMTTTGPDTIGTVIAHKRIGDQELIVSTIVQPVPEIAETCVSTVLSKHLSNVPSLICLPVSYACGGTTRE